MEELPDPAQDRDAQLVESAADLEALADRLARCPLVAVDIEANGLHAYRESVCVVQVATPKESAIIDAVALEDLSPLRDALENPQVESVFHGGDFDVALLGRGHGIRFHRLFDTMIAATLLGEPKVGLADLVREAYGVELDKRYQRVDWRRRPLTPDHLDYLHRDTAYLLPLRAALRARLEEADILEEAAIEFAYVASRRREAPSSFDPDGWRRMKGARGLDARARSILAELYRWREKEAERRNAPSFKVAAPALMVSLSKSPPDRLRGPDDLRGLPRGLVRRYGRSLVTAIRRGIDRAEAERAPPARTDERPTAAQRDARKSERQLDDKVRKWRRGEAESRKVPNAVVLPNRAIEYLVRKRPQSLDELAECTDIGPKRIALYGEPILKIVRRA